MIYYTHKQINANDKQIMAMFNYTLILFKSDHQPSNVPYFSQDLETRCWVGFTDEIEVGNIPPSWIVFRHL